MGHRLLGPRIDFLELGPMGCIEGMYILIIRDKKGKWMRPA